MLIHEIFELKVSKRQALKVRGDASNFRFMVDTTVKVNFAQRLNELCDEMGVPERGRQTAFGKIFGVVPNSARKWLLGDGLPELETVVAIANWADVNVNWLLQGAGPKRGNRVDSKALLLDEAVRMLPRELGLDLVDNLRAKLERLGKIRSGEPGGSEGRYRTMLDSYEHELGRKPN